VPLRSCAQPFFTPVFVTERKRGMVDAKEAVFKPFWLIVTGADPMIYSFRIRSTKKRTNRADFKF
jgi:hypothetical protein